MPEWLIDTTSTGGELSLAVLALRLTVAVLLGFVVAAVYCASQRRKSTDFVPFVTTLVLLTALVAMTTLVIGNSVARAFSLVGAMSIVRFRSTVEDTRDTAFVIFAVVVGMAAGAGNLDVAFVGIPLVGGAAFALKAWGWSTSSAPERRLEIRLGSGHDPAALLDGALREQLASHRLTSVITARQGAAFDLVYLVRLRDPDQALAFVRTLNQIEGVQQVELRDA